MKFIIHRQYWKEHKDWFIVSANGCALVRLSFYYVDNSYWINDLFVNKLYRHKSYASKLLNICDKISAGNKIHVVPINKKTEDMYLKRGYILEKDSDE